MRKVFLVCLVALLTSCIGDSFSEQNEFVDDEDYQPNEVLEEEISRQDINSCSYVGGITALYFDDKEVFIYHPVVCLQPFESFPEMIPTEMIPDNSEIEFDINNQFDNFVKENLVQ